MYTLLKKWLLSVSLVAFCGTAVAQNVLINEVGKNGTSQTVSGDDAFQRAQTLAGEGDIKAAVKELRKAAKMGHRQAICDLGYCYDYGKGVKHDVKMAAKLYRQSGIGEGWYRLAMCYLGGELSPKGNLTLQDSLEGMSLMYRAVGAGYDGALYAMGEYYGKRALSADRQTGLLMDYDSALYYYGRAADLSGGEYPIIWMRMANLYANRPDGGADSSLVVYYYRKASQADYGPAHMALGDLYATGRYVPRDGQQALAHYRSAAALNNPLGAFRVAQCLYQGLGAQADTTEAIQALKTAAGMGSGQACHQMGVWYLYGAPYVEKNSDSAFYYFHTGAMVSDASCLDRLGDMYLANSDFDNAATLYRLSAEQGSYQGLLDYAMMLRDGKGFKKANPEEAYEWIKVAAMEGDLPSAWLEMGYCHYAGLGCETDYDKAFRFFDSAAVRGNSRAMFNLAICYQEGVGCKADSVMMLRWLDSAVAHGNISAVNKLGGFYESGRYVEKDYAKAVELYRYGMETLGSYESYCCMGYCYETGHGVILNSAEAFRHYKVAADGGFRRGLYCVANCYADGIGVEKDEATAFAYYTAAADAGHPVAQYIVGETYREGTSYAKQDKKKAKQYLSLSASQDYEPAQAALKRMK